MNHDQRVATVLVRPICPLSDLCSNDADLAGEYPIYLKPEVTQQQIAYVALDVFHSHIAVSVLDDFIFTVVYEGQEIEPGDEYEPYSLSELGEM